MKITVYHCDICDKESDPDEMIHTESGKDVCVACMAKLIDRHFEKMEAVLKSACAKAPLPSKKEEKVCCKKAAEENIDWPKAQALRDAGWGPKKIGAEMGIPWQLVLHRTEAPAEKKVFHNEWNVDDIKRLGVTDKDEIEEVMADGIS